MSEKRPIDIKRESSGKADVGSKEDGAILEMINIGDRLIIIKEKSIYELIMADKIDPQRTNIGLPSSIHRLIINQGVDSEIVSRTFLTAKILFTHQFFGDTIDTVKAVSLSLDLLFELSALEKEINNYIIKEQNVSNEYEQKRNKLGSYSIPSIGDVVTSCKTIFQKADHIEQILMEIIMLFYPNDSLTKQSHFPKFYEVITNKYGKDDTFSKFLGGILYFMKVVRELRNGLDHRLDFVTVMDFEIKADGKILSPTIELNHKEVKLMRVALLSFLPTVLWDMVSVFEITIAYLSNKNVKKGFVPYTVKTIPEDRRRNKFIKYAFWSPIGDGGYYHQ